VNSPRWSDDELLLELGTALREQAFGDDSVIRAAQAAFTWRSVDAGLELLCLVADRGPAVGSLVRGGAPGGPRTLVFHGERRSVEIEIHQAGIIGQLTPARAGQVTLLTAAGPQATTQANDIGCFALPLRSGPLRLGCRLGSDRFVTEWVAI